MFPLAVLFEVKLIKKKKFLLVYVSRVAGYFKDWDLVQGTLGLLNEKYIRLYSTNVNKFDW